MGLEDLHLTLDLPIGVKEPPQDDQYMLMMVGWQVSVKLCSVHLHSKCNYQVEQQMKNPAGGQQCYSVWLDLYLKMHPVILKKFINKQGWAGPMILGNENIEGSKISGVKCFGVAKREQSVCAMGKLGPQHKDLWTGLSCAK